MGVQFFQSVQALLQVVSKSISPMMMRRNITNGRVHVLLCPTIHFTKRKDVERPTINGTTIRRIKQARRFLNRRTRDLPTHFFQAVRQVIQINGTNDRILNRRGALLPVRRRSGITINARLERNIVIIVEPLRRSNRGATRDLVIQRVDRFPPLYVHHGRFMITTILFLRPFKCFQFKDVGSFRFLPT